MVCLQHENRINFWKNVNPIQIQHNLTSLKGIPLQMVFIFLMDELIYFPRPIPPQMDWGKMRKIARNKMKEKNVC
jgi:hypothetical protein